MQYFRGFVAQGVGADVGLFKEVEQIYTYIYIYIYRERERGFRV